MMKMLSFSKAYHHVKVLHTGDDLVVSQFEGLMTCLPTLRLPHTFDDRKLNTKTTLFTFGHRGDKLSLFCAEISKFRNGCCGLCACGRQYLVSRTTFLVSSSTASSHRVLSARPVE